MRRSPVVLVILASLSLSRLGRAQEEKAWEPANTFALVVSVCEWKDSSLATFKKGRKDDAFVEAIERAGVPVKNVTYLKDTQATLESMRRELHAIARRSGKGTTLLFYYQGHGTVVHGLGAFLANYDLDARRVAETGFPVAEIGGTLAKEWQGNCLLLIGDCCHSGDLAGAVERFEAKPDVRAACIPSTMASNRSTGRWTFTEAVIEALEGDGRVDEDHDGTLTFAELDRFVTTEMRYREGQLTHAAHTRSFPDAFALRSVDPASAEPAASLGPWKLRDYCEAQDMKGNWYVSQVIGIVNGKYRVHFLEWEDKWDETIDGDRLRAVPRGTARIGERYQVIFEEGRRFPGVIVKTDGDFYFVHYEDEAGEDDEWVMQGKLGDSLGSAPDAGEAFAIGDSVAAGWHKTWYLAKVTARDGRLIDVRYDDDTTGSLVGSEIRKLAAASELSEGVRVLASWKGKPRLYPGVVEKRTATGVVVAWDDGSRSTEVPFGMIALEGK